MVFLNNSLTNKKVLVMGLGRNNGGSGSVIFALKSNASEVIANDSKDEVFNEPSIIKIKEFIKANNIDPNKVKFIFNGHNLSDFLNSDVIIKNPAVPFSNEIIKECVSAGKLIETEITLFLQNKNPDAKVIGITGSKGKSSTTYLIFHILTEAFKIGVIKKEVLLGGNMGISLLDSINQDFDGLYVLELSSFATEAIFRNKQSLDYFLITSLYPDHLNYYSNLDEYYHSKVDLIKNLNEENVFINDTNSDLSDYTKNYNVNRIDVLKDPGLEFPEYFNEPLIQNSILVANFLIKTFNIPLDFISQCLKTFKVVEGRFEFIGSKQKVDFINDCCASIPEAAIAGLNTLIKKNKRIFQITGGSDKGLKFDELFKIMNKFCEKIYLIKGGNTFDIYYENLDKSKLLICENLEDAERKSFTEAINYENSVVILSRGCTSFGVANNEFEMGRDFVKIFNDL